MFGEDGEDFTINLDVSFFELVDQLGIGDAVVSCRGIDFNSPKVAHSALFLFTVGELKTPSVQQCFTGLAGLGFAGPQKPFRVFEQSLSALGGADASFYSCHVITC
ncbi:MAG: hypothetical protein UY36_C0002G0006 [Parcubacteria group bacterium GW2011_GWA1_49_11]|nr:MAG: hypothetical protein UY36_C0002G0006 [Parcubacteria group bacterium GW2011_GWA1_49_11]